VDAVRIAVVLACVLVLSLVVLTVLGERRRGGPWVLAVVAGCAFPVTWVVWYVRDVRPYASARHP